jgi:hypothetical protein
MIHEASPDTNSVCYAVLIMWRTERLHCTGELKEHYCTALAQKEHTLRAPWHAFGVMQHGKG